MGRAPQGRHDRRLLRRHQPAVRRRDAAAEPGRDHAAVGASTTRTTTLYPGGILNTGFALSWAKDRADDAKPATKTGGQAWALKRIKGGDKTCKANQALHAEAIDLIAKVRANNHYVPKVADPLAPDHVREQDQRAGLPRAASGPTSRPAAHCPTLPQRFTGTKRKWFTFTNGIHTDSLDPATFNRWYDFLELYVAQRGPHLPDGRAGARAGGLQRP